MNLLKALKYVSVDLLIVTLSLCNDREKKLQGQINKFHTWQCTEVMPLFLVLSSTYDPHLSRSSVIYYFDSSTLGDWPIHDQCGTNKANQQKELKSSS